MMFPTFEALYKKYHNKGLEMVAISQESEQKVQQFKPLSGVSYPLYIDVDGSANIHYKVDSIPRTFIIGKDGTIAWQETGESKDSLDEMVAVVDKLMAGS
jgi:peroxiredoxin